jgi:hypothetical protein
MGLSRKLAARAEAGNPGRLTTSQPAEQRGRCNRRAACPAYGLGTAQAAATRARSGSAMPSATSRSWVWRT